MLCQIVKGRLKVHQMDFYLWWMDHWMILITTIWTVWSKHYNRSGLVDPFISLSYLMLNIVLSINDKYVGWLIVDCQGKSLFQCRVMDNCSLIATIFLLLVTVTTVKQTIISPPHWAEPLQVSLLTCVTDSTPLLPEDVGQDSLKIIKNGPQCVVFGIFIIWWQDVD